MIATFIGTIFIALLAIRGLFAFGGDILRIITRKNTK
jgi:hypothetical protein